MNPNCVRKPDPIKLIMECRQSGLSDYQWCQKQGIYPGTFYNWVSRLRKAGYTIPDSESKVSVLPASQEVVKLDLTERETSAHTMMEQNANLPALPVASGLAAHVTYGKFINALPYYRKEKDFENQFGIKIGRGTMAHWTIYCAQNYFSPMPGYFHRQLVKRKYVAADETPIQVLKEADRRPQSKSYVWLFRSGDDRLPSIIVYQYHLTRNGYAAAKFFQGAVPGTYINADRYAGYNKLKNFKRCCCYAHIRRYFLEAILEGKEKDYTDPAVHGLLYCNKLFEYERT